MTELRPIVKLKETLPEDAWSWVIPALRQDPVVWDALQDPDQVDQAARKIGSNPLRWTPMNIALVCLGMDITVEDLRTITIKDLSPQLYQQVVQAFKNYQAGPPTKIELSCAGLLALYYFEHEKDVVPPLPTTSLSCFYSLHPEPVELIIKFNPEVAIHVVLSNPLPPDEQEKVFWEYMNLVEPGSWSSIIKLLANKKPEIASLLAAKIIDTWPEKIANLTSQIKSESPIQNLAIILKNSDVLSIAKEEESYLNQIEEALGMIEEIRSEVTTRLVEQEIIASDIDQAHSHWKQIKSNASPVQAANVFLTLVKHNFSSEARTWFRNNFTDDKLDEPEYILARGYLEHLEKNNEGAKEAVQVSLEGFVKGMEPELKHLHLLTRLAIDVDLSQEALDAVNLALELEPNDATSVCLLRECHQALDHQAEAINAAHLSIAMQPDRLEHRRDLAKTLENANQWSHAMQVRSTILASHKSLELEDAYQDAVRFAVCALKLDNPQNTAEICQKLLKINPIDPETHHLLGKSYLSMGEADKAQVNFSQATKLAPLAPKSWLALADVYHEIGQKSRQKETLQAAANIITDDPEIYLDLGQIHLEEASPTLALQNFRIANSLANATRNTTFKEIKSKAAFFFGNTLNQLGHHHEARSVLEVAYNADRDHMEIAHSYARALLATQSPSDALPILDETRKRVPDSTEINMDFARASLATASNLDETRDTLVKILEIETDNYEAKALLAETYEGIQDFELALDTYSEALGSSLRDDPTWLTRLSLGLSRVYLGKKQPENAIAVLNSALKNTNDEQMILKSLSTAYHAANLREKALWAAKSVLDQNTNDEENLNWFVQQAIEIGATNNAIKVLEEASHIKSKVASYPTNLGWLYIYEGDFDKARKTFKKIRNLEQVTSSELHQASQGLMAVNDATTAIDLIDKAINLGQSTGDTEIIPKLLSSKVIAYQKNADLDLALKTLEEAIELSPHDPALVQKKAGLLLELESYDLAIACIEDGFNQFPKNRDLHLQAVIVYRTCGQLFEASYHAREYLTLLSEEEDMLLDVYAASILTDLADAMIQTWQVKDILDMVDLKSSFVEPAAIHLYCLQGEIGLESDFEIQAAESLNAAIENNPNHPRTLALQARLTSRQGDHETARKVFQKALKAAGSYPGIKDTQTCSDEDNAFFELEYPVSTYIALAETCLDFNDWQAGNVLLQKAMDLAPEEPRSHYKLARALVLRAEHQRLCDTVNAVKHAPGKSTIVNYSYKNFEAAILQAAHLITRLSQSTTEDETQFAEARDQIATWLARGQAVFQPSFEHALAIEKLPENPDNSTALLAVLRQCGELDEAWKKAQNLQTISEENITNAHLLGQIALALSEKSPKEALEASQTAIEISQWQHLPEQPIFHAIKARIAEQINEHDLQKQALQDALEIWEEEPVWLSTFADIYLKSGNMEDVKKSIPFLEKASVLEPKKMDHYMKLGKAHQLINNTKGTIVVLDQATRNIPEQPEPWLALAKAHYSIGEIAQAIRCAKTVIQVDPTGVCAPLLLGEISLEVNNPQKAAHYVDDVLARYPKNPDALVLRAAIYSALNKPEHALEFIEKAIPILPNSVPLRLNRAKLIQEIKGTKHALDVLIQLTDEYPNNPQILAALAEAYSNLNEPEKAILRAQEAVNAADNILDKQEHIATLTLLSRLLRKMGQLDQSIHYINKMIEKDPERADPYIELGRCFQEQRLYDRALGQFQKAIQLSPEDYKAYYYSGFVLKETNDFLNAERMFKTAAKLEPKNMNIYRQLAAVTAINFVQNHQNRTQRDDRLTMAVSMEGTEK